MLCVRKGRLCRPLRCRDGCHVGYIDRDGGENHQSFVLVVRDNYGPPVYPFIMIDHTLSDSAGRPAKRTRTKQNRFLRCAKQGQPLIRFVLLWHCGSHFTIITYSRPTMPGILPASIQYRKYVLQYRVGRLFNCGLFSAILYT